MESIYYAICWHCHRRCKHCYDDRFKPYTQEQQQEVVSSALQNALSVIEHLPKTLGYQDKGANDINQNANQILPTRLILSGGEVLTDAVRSTVLYPVLERLQSKYGEQNNLRVIIQTTGDLVTEEIVRQLLDYGVWYISISGHDDYHTGMTGERGERILNRLYNIFKKTGVTPTQNMAQVIHTPLTAGPFYSIFGANQDTWIGKLWPRGRAWENSLCDSKLSDNFCKAWSGGLNFFNQGQQGSEVSIDPDGNVYPCCIKTREPLGNLTEERLTAILDDVRQEPALQAINLGQPETMGTAYGWTKSQFQQASTTRTPSGKAYTNLCVGCDRFHQEVLSTILKRRRRARLGLAQNTIACETID